MTRQDDTLAYLLDLDGEEIRYPGGHIARFRVTCVAPSPQRPHGIVYSLTLHNPLGQRILGFDNAHAVRHPGSRHVVGPTAFDHWHRSADDIGRPYEFTTAADLVADFFDAVAACIAWTEE